MGWTTKISGAHSRPGSRAADTLSLLSQDRQTVTTRTHARVRATPGTRRRHRACIALHAQPKAVLPVTPSGFAHVTARRVTRSQQATAPATAAHPACSCDRRCRTRTVPAAHAASWRHMRPAADDLARLRKLEMVATTRLRLRRRRAPSPSHARAWPPPKSTAVAAAAAVRSAQVARQRWPRSHSSARTSRPARSHLSRAPVSSPALFDRLGRGVGQLGSVQRHARSRSSSRRSSAALLRAGGPELDRLRCSVSLRRARYDDCTSA